MTHRRRNFPPQVMRDAWDRCKDESGVPRCEHCTAQLSDANVHYDERADGQFDHGNPDALLGEPTLENCQVLCRTCHGRKTKRDRKDIAKSNHVRDRGRGIKSQNYQPLLGTKASGIKKPFRGRPIVRATGEEWGRR